MKGKNVFKNLGFLPTVIVGCVCLILFALAGQGVLMFFNESQIASMRQLIALQKDMADLEKSKSSVNARASLQTEPILLSVEMSNCSQLSGLEPQKLELGMRYVFPSGCAMVSISETIRAVEGEGYLLQEFSNPTINGCGSVGMNDGRPRSGRECAGWLNSQSKRNVRITVTNGTTLTITT